MKSFSVRTCAFTLPELMVVTAVFTVLGTMFYMEVQKSRAAGMRAACRNNQKCLWGGINYYSEHAEYGVILPGGIEGLQRLYDNGNGIIGVWTGYTCPSIRTPESFFTVLSGDAQTDYNLDALLCREDKQSKIILSDEPQRQEDGTLAPNIFGNHGDGANFTFTDGHCRWYSTPNPTEDSDSDSVYEGTSSTTNTYID